MGKKKGGACKWTHRPLEDISVLAYSYNRAQEPCRVPLRQLLPSRPTLSGFHKPKNRIKKTGCLPALGPACRSDTIPSLSDFYPLRSVLPYLCEARFVDPLKFTPIQHVLLGKAAQKAALISTAIAIEAKIRDALKKAAEHPKIRCSGQRDQGFSMVRAPGRSIARNAASSSGVISGGSA